MLFVAVLAPPAGPLGSSTGTFGRPPWGRGGMNLVAGPFLQPSHQPSRVMRDAVAPDPPVKRTGKEAVPDAVTEDFARTRVPTGVGNSPRGARFPLARELPKRFDRESCAGGGCATYVCSPVIVF